LKGVLAAKILHVGNFYNRSGEEFDDAVTAVVNTFSRVPKLCLVILTLNAILFERSPYFLALPPGVISIVLDYVCIACEPARLLDMAVAMWFEYRHLGAIDADGRVCPVTRRYGSMMRWLSTVCTLDERMKRAKDPGSFLTCAAEFPKPDGQYDAWMRWQKPIPQLPSRYSVPFWRLDLTSLYVNLEMPRIVSNFRPILSGLADWMLGGQETRYVIGWGHTSAATTEQHHHQRLILMIDATPVKNYLPPLAAADHAVIVVTAGNDVRPLTVGTVEYMASCLKQLMLMTQQLIPVLKFSVTNHSLTWRALGLSTPGWYDHWTRRTLPHYQYRDLVPTMLRTPVQFVYNEETQELMMLSLLDEMEQHPINRLWYVLPPLMQEAENVQVLVESLHLENDEMMPWRHCLTGHAGPFYPLGRLGWYDTTMYQNGYLPLPPGNA
jgi:hypothetical protein